MDVARAADACEHDGRFFKEEMMSLKWMTKHIAFLGLLGAIAPFGSTALAGTVTGAFITQVLVELPGANGSDGAFFVYVSVAPTGSPSCATLKRFAIDPTTPSGQAMIQTVLSEKATDSPIDITGTGTCDVWVDSETILYVVAH